MTYRATGIEPGHDRLRLRGPTIRQRECGVVGRLQTLGISRKDSCVKLCSVRTEDTDHVMLTDVIRQREQVGPRGQDVSGKLNGLTKCNYRFLIELTCTRSRQDDQKCNKNVMVANALTANLFFITAPFFSIAAQLMLAIHICNSELVRSFSTVASFVRTGCKPVLFPVAFSFFDQ
jgi:hypothetical protein